MLPTPSVDPFAQQRRRPLPLNLLLLKPPTLTNRETDPCANPRTNLCTDDSCIYSTPYACSNASPNARSNPSTNVSPNTRSDARSDASSNPSSNSSSNARYDASSNPSTNPCSNPFSNPCSYTSSYTSSYPEGLQPGSYVIDGELWILDSDVVLHLADQGSAEQTMVQSLSNEDQTTALDEIAKFLSPAFIVLIKEEHKQQLTAYHDDINLRAKYRIRPK
ncbi:hypothetical protein Ae201684P_016920 [Aphanomyces euteiches]|nr:hypothetical protein Ae201684P_016920 [Aphanomyces euteiches]KAH9140087.1 hypothetical protein AeRB84_015694 [Aphanomyces euteiches]